MYKEIDESKPVMLRPSSVYFAKFKKGTEIYNELKEYLTARTSLMNELLAFKYQRLFPAIRLPQFRIASILYEIFIKIPDVENKLHGNIRVMTFQEKYLPSFFSEIRQLNFEDYFGEVRILEKFSIPLADLAEIVGIVREEVRKKYPDETDFVPKMRNYISMMEGLLFCNTIVFDKKNSELNFLSGEMSMGFHRPRSKSKIEYSILSEKYGVPNIYSVFTKTPSCGGKVLHTIKRTPLNNEYLEIVNKYKDIGDWKEIQAKIVPSSLNLDIDISDNEELHKDVVLTRLIRSPHLTFSHDSEDIYITITTKVISSWSSILNCMANVPPKTLEKLRILYRDSDISNSIYELERKLSPGIISLNTDILKPITIFDNDVLMSVLSSFRAPSIAKDELVAESEVLKNSESRESTEIIKEYGIPIPSEIEKYFSESFSRQESVKVFNDHELRSMQIILKRRFALKARSEHWPKELISMPDKSRLKFSFERINYLFRSSVFRFREEESSLRENEEGSLMENVLKDHYNINDVMVVSNFKEYNTLEYLSAFIDTFI